MQKQSSRRCQFTRRPTETTKTSYAAAELCRAISFVCVHAQTACTKSTWSLDKQASSLCAQLPHTIYTQPMNVTSKFSQILAIMHTRHLHRYYVYTGTDSHSKILTVILWNSYGYFLPTGRSSSAQPPVSNH